MNEPTLKGRVKLGTDINITTLYIHNYQVV